MILDFIFHNERTRINQTDQVQLGHFVKNVSAGQIEQFLIFESFWIEIFALFNHNENLQPSMARAPLACPRYSMYQAEDLIKKGAIIENGLKLKFYTKKDKNIKITSNRCRAVWRFKGHANLCTRISVGK